LSILQEEIKALKPEGSVFMDFGERNDTYLKQKDIPQNIIDVLANGFGTIGDLHQLQVSDVENLLKHAAKKETNSQNGEKNGNGHDKKEETPEVKIDPTIQLRLKVALEKCSKAIDIKERKFELDDPLKSQFDRLGISQPTQEQFFKRGLTAVRQLAACGTDKIIAKFGKSKFKISFQDKVFMTQAAYIVAHRIDEKEILV